MNLFSTSLARRGFRLAVLAGVPALLLACDYETRYPTEPRRLLASLSLSIADTILEAGQPALAIASARDDAGVPIHDAVVSFTSTNPGVAGVNPLDGRILAVAPGTTTIIATSGEQSARRDVVVHYPEIFINEVVPLGNSSEGWVELFNPTSKTIDLSQWVITNGDIWTFARLPVGVAIPGHGYLIINESAFPGGLASKDFIHLFSRFGVQSDAFAWGHEPAASYGRCPDGQSGLGETLVATKGAANAC